MAEEKKITVTSQEERRFTPPPSFVDKAYIKSHDERMKLWKESVENPNEFWLKIAKEMIYWKKEPTKGFDFKDKEKIHFTWFEDGITNMAYNCLDKHVEAGNGDQIALIWQGDPLDESKTYTYKQLLSEVNKASNVLKNLGVKKGDRVTMYLPMIPELTIIMLACVRIGAIHSIVFGGFTADSLKDRILDCEGKVLVTADGYYRNGKIVPQKKNADRALEETPNVESVLVVQRMGMDDTPWTEGRDAWYHEELAKVDDKCEPEWVNAEDPLFILYTSGSTGKPKGVLHTTGGYMTYTTYSFKTIFDWHPGDVYWCTADIGWITGHSYIVYGPLSAGATTLMFEGTPTYPDNDRFWLEVERWKVTQFYTAPTAIRALMRFGDEPVKRHDMSSLNLLGTVGEPINPKAWMWYHEVVGKEDCPIVDTYWQTETGGVIITPLPGATATIPGSCTHPFFGVDPIIVDETGAAVGPNEGGYLCIRKPWPGLMRTVYGDHDRFINTYWIQYKDPDTSDPMYMTGDGSRFNEDGYYFVMGRIDDVLKVSGHRLGTAEIESALVKHPAVSECAVVGFPHEIKGEDIYVFATLRVGVDKTDDLRQELKLHVRREIGPIATPAKIQFADALPKTRSGKIMRRILKRIAAGQIDDIGDTTTLADPTVVETLIKERL
ncbi:MAG: acetate--CoA ligase [Candidatus Thorarchaeota archaeon SMTZ1-83]|nr:MAG: acetyl-coenzyme A synthetase [Candidatus Thorarchaeota archaeon SMTZ1-83]